MPLQSRRRFFLAAAATLGLRRARAEGKSPPRIGYLSGAGYPELEQAFTSELSAQGMHEGLDVTIERRLARANTDDLRLMARELASADLVLVVATALPAALLVREANPRMPMVIGTCPGLVANGFANTLERPGGIYTGIDELPPGVTEKRLALLKAAAPGVTRVALLSTTPGTVAHGIQLADAQRAAAAMKVEVRPYRATSLDGIRRALDSMQADGMQALQNFQGGLSLANRQIIVDFAAARRMPAIYQARAFVAAGGLMAWAPDQPEQLRIAARMVARILRGARPGDVPAVYAPRYELLLNDAAARAVGVEFPRALLDQAAATAGPA